MLEDDKSAAPSPDRPQGSVVDARSAIDRVTPVGAVRMQDPVNIDTGVGDVATSA